MECSTIEKCLRYLIAKLKYDILRCNCSTLQHSFNNFFPVLADAFHTDPSIIDYLSS